MNLPTSPLLITVFMVIVANRIVEFGFKPIRGALIKANESLGWLNCFTPYIAWAIAGGLVWLTEISLFGTLIPTFQGRVLSAILAGGGANLLHDLFTMPENLGFSLTAGLTPLLIEDFLNEEDLPEGECCSTL